MGGIFISYRRTDSQSDAGRLRDALRNHFGEEQVFRDINTIKPGEQFPRIVKQWIKSCDALLAIIGPTWSTVTDANGRRLDNPKDLVRGEITTALRRPNLLVIPVLIGTTPMPVAAELPQPLAALTERNAMRLSDEGWDDQVARLIRELETRVRRTVVPTLGQAAAAGGADPGTQQRQRAVAKLVEAVRLQWAEEAKVRGLFDPDPMPVQWGPTEHEVSDHNRFVTPDSMTIGGSSNRMADLTKQFLTLSRRRLVILGGPGSGKSTLAVQLLLRLVDVRTPADPVPVLLTANGWDTTAHPRLQDWLAFRLGKDYPALRAIGETMPRELADNGMVLPIIDGLDELDPEYRPALLKTLNDSLGERDPLILTCRTDEYVDAVDAADVLTAAAVIEARPLTARDAAGYLDDCLPPSQRPRWNPILEELRSGDDTPIAKVCSTPLGVWLLRSVHIENKQDPTPLVDAVRYPDADAIKADLFDQLIPALIDERRPVRNGSDPLRPRRAWDPNATRRWMGYLAVQLHGQRDQRWWQLAAAVPAGVTMMVLALAGVLAAGMTTWLIVAVLNGLTGQLASAMGKGLKVGLLVAPVVGLVFGLVVGWKLRARPEPGYTNLHFHGRVGALARSLAVRVLRVMAISLPIGLLLGLGLVWMSGAEWATVPWTGVIVALWSGLVFGPAVGVTKWMRVPVSNDLSRTPTSTYRASRNLTIFSVLAFPLPLAVAFGITALASRLVPGDPLPIVPMIVFGLLVGMLVGLVVGPRQEPAWIGFAMTSRWLAFRGKLPWNVMRFLDDAHRLGLLRTAGAVYQFRHAELQDHLAKSRGAPSG
ncbi:MULTISPECIES: TIR domain-containing protein [unclassified Mycobacterium]|uniref:TIR domain-containing protein n=1 Tax=unclassified Mycobacterium TaxID=2642494 RepID=UPI0029C775B2|nr:MULTISPECIES: TIR domain-containing protein [unclassified Mycobacterium]